MTSILTEASRKAAERHAERIEKELLGAWRAGYDYLYRYVIPGPPYRETFIPENRTVEHAPGMPRMIEYDLRGITIEDVESCR